MVFLTAPASFIWKILLLGFRVSGNVFFIQLFPLSFSVVFAKWGGDLLLLGFFLLHASTSGLRTIRWSNAFARSGLNSSLSAPSRRTSTKCLCGLQPSSLCCSKRMAVVAAAAADRPHHPRLKRRRNGWTPKSVVPLHLARLRSCWLKTTLAVIKKTGFCPVFTVYPHVPANAANLSVHSLMALLPVFVPSPASHCSLRLSRLFS